MTAIRRLGWVGLGAGLAVTALGVGLAAGSAIVAGDWWLAREPWIGAGLTTLVVGLAATALFALWLDVVEPLGWSRLLAVPSTLVVGFLWVVWLVFGLPTTGPGGGPERVVRTILYSVPELLVVVVVGTILMALPLAVRAFASRAGTSSHPSARPR